MSKPLIVIDTTVFISAHLIKGSVSAQVFDKILQVGNIALSEPLLSEYMNVIYRKKLDKYLSESKRQAILHKIVENALMFVPTLTINDCRDRKDNIILELAMAWGAACIVTGHADLMVMHPFRSISILSGSEFLTEF